MTTVTIKIGDKTYKCAHTPPKNRQKTFSECQLCGTQDHTTRMHPIENHTFGFMIEEREPNETFEEYWKKIREQGECTFCGQQGHTPKNCELRKQNQCKLCGFFGHTPKKCNKGLKAPDGKRVGKCTFCKGDAKWGHWLLTCPSREEKYGPFVFPEGVDQELALRPLVNKH